MPLLVRLTYRQSYQNGLSYRSTDRGRAHRHDRWEVLRDPLPCLGFIGAPPDLACLRAEVDPDGVEPVGREPFAHDLGARLRETVREPLPRLAAVARPEVKIGRAHV